VQASRFFLARVCRIYPAVITSIAIFVALFFSTGLSLTSPEQYSPWIIFLNGLLLSTTIDGVMWSLQLELIAAPLIFLVWLAWLRFGNRALTVTFVVLVVLVITKFIHGAWIVIFLIPLLVLMFRAVHSHYEEVAKQLTTEGLERLRPIKHEVIVPISGIHRGVIRALEYAKSIAPGHVTAVYVDLDEEATKTLREKWEKLAGDIELVVLASPYRALTSPLLRYIARVEREHKDDLLTIVLPEFVPARWWQHLLHNQSSLMLKGALLFKEGVIVTNVPYHLKR